MSESTALLSKLPSKHVEPLWTVMKSMVTSQPSPRAEPAIWRYDEIRPLLCEAGQTVPTEQAERRVLMLINPQLSAPFTTDTLYAGLQLINPGEVAPAHRHRSFALRFIIEGSGAFTAVEGNKVFMQPGDVILTPKWQWHDHGHSGSGPMIWLDGLDLPLYHKFPIHFSEPYTDPTYPSKVVDNSPLRYPWQDIRSKLDAADGDYAAEEYRDASTGRPIAMTIGAMAMRVRSGAIASPKRDTCSFVFHVVAGKGKTIIKGNKEATFEWKRGDTFAVPAWSNITHEASPDEDAYLFVLTDKPLLDNLGMYLVDDK